MRIICKKCHHTLEVDPGAGGTPPTTVPCPNCAHEIKCGSPGRPHTLYWLQCGGCGGDTWSFFNAHAPNVVELFSYLNIDVLWHPSLSIGDPGYHQRLVEQLAAGEKALDFLCVEGSVIRGPGGTGMFDTLLGRAKKDTLAALAKTARYVLAVGTCASFGGVGADGEIEATGIQYHKWNPGGFLGEAFRTRSGLPAINMPGCPCHEGVITGVLSELAGNSAPALDAYNQPGEWYGTLVHQGCTRNEYHEYRVEEKKFGEKGCLYYYLGCHGPLVYGPCNKLLWNRRSSKTRVGTPCVGCTRPDFPQPYPFFVTRNIEGIPIELPAGVDRAHYLAYKGIAAAAAPERLKDRETGI